MEYSRREIKRSIKANFFEEPITKLLQVETTTRAKDRIDRI